ncbi:MAG: HVO_0476 family zinc finger protein [Candidatus Thermoplasmatota archaeon]|nr:HVO_0476 family zinc finger protein [Candidatus Thermoplasmatota archaeon]
MAEGEVIVVFCEVCGTETPHKVIHAGFGPDPNAGFSGKVQCRKCTTIHHTEVPSEKNVSIPLVLSDGDTSSSQRLVLGYLEEISLGEELIFEGHNILITAILKDDRKINRAKAGDISILHAKVFDTLVVKISISSGSRTRADSLRVPPDEEFEVGDLLDLNRGKVVVSSILSDIKVRREGLPVPARYIKRIYAKPVRERSY